jgi:hypothetical protein
MMTKISYGGYRFPSEIIQQAIWLYVRFTLSLRDVEDLLAERGILVSYESVRRWVNHFRLMIAGVSRKRRPKPHTIWHLDEVYLKIDGPFKTIDCGKPPHRLFKSSLRFCSSRRSCGVRALRCRASSSRIRRAISARSRTAIAMPSAGVREFGISPIVAIGVSPASSGGCQVASGPLGTASGRRPCRLCGVDRDLRDFGQIFVPQLALAGDEFAAQIMQHAVKFELRRA